VFLNFIQTGNFGLSVAFSLMKYNWEIPFYRKVDSKMLIAKSPRPPPPFGLLPQIRR